MAAKLSHSPLFQGRICYSWLTSRASETCLPHLSRRFSPTNPLHQHLRLVLLVLVPLKALVSASFVYFVLLISMFLLPVHVCPFVWYRIYTSRSKTVEWLRSVVRIFGISFVENTWRADCSCFLQIGWSSHYLCRVRCCRGNEWKRWNSSLIVYSCRGIAHNAQVPFLITQCHHLCGWIAASSRRSESAGVVGAGAVYNVFVHVACWIAWLVK